ncbi:MAG: hypothetical protein WCK98_02345 [bacterium]
MPKSFFNALLIQRFVAIVAILFSILSLVSGVRTQAAIDSSCSAPIVSIKWWDLANPGKFLPVIPNDCAENGDGLKPLSLKTLPTIAIRLFGFLVSLAFALIFPLIVFAGIWYMWGGIDSSGTDQAKKLLLNGLYGWLMLAAFYILVFAVLGLLGGVNDLDLESTSVETFFK